MNITDSLHKIPNVTANVYLLLDADGLALIDVGLPRNEEKILTYIASLGYSADDLKHILITHADSDHAGSLGPLLRYTPASAYASQLEAEAIRAGKFSRPLKLHGWRKWLYRMTIPFFGPAPVPVETVLADGDTLPILGGLQVVFSPGHTPGHLSYFAPEAGILFCGDSLRVIKGQLSISRGASTWDESLAVDSALKQAALGAKIVCAGHGPVLRDGGDYFDHLTKGL